MLKKLFALLVLAALAAVAYVYWRGRTPHLPALGRPAEALSRVGDKLREGKIAGSVKAAVELHDELRALPIEAGVDDEGVVTLSGKVAAPRQREEAERVAAAVPGVRSVVNGLSVDERLPAAGGEGRSLGESLDDKALEAKVRLAFSLDRALDGTDVTVSAFRRAVTLGGDVHTASQRELAAEIAARTAGVASVANQIRLRGRPDARADGAGAIEHEGASSSRALRMDGRARAAERAVAANPNLAAYALRVGEREGRLVLSGRVRTGAEKDLAGLLARDAARTDVRNDVRIEP